MTRIVDTILGVENGEQVIIGKGRGVFVSADVLDPALLRNIEIASRPTIHPSPVMLLQVDSPKRTRELVSDIPWADLDVGPWTSNPQAPVPGTRGTGACCILYASVSGAGNVQLWVRRKGDESEAGTFRHGSKDDSKGASRWDDDDTRDDDKRRDRARDPCAYPYNSIMLVLGLGVDQLLQYKVIGRGSVEVRFIGYFERPRIVT